MYTQKEIMRLAEENSKTYFAYQEWCYKKNCHSPTPCRNAAYVSGIFHCSESLDTSDLEESYWWI